MEHGAERAALTTPRGSRSSRFKATATASEATVSPPGRACAATQTWPSPRVANCRSRKPLELVAQCGLVEGLAPALAADISTAAR
jgi:hypothetical protein